MDNPTGLDAFREVWCVDTEYHPIDGVEGNAQDVVCLVAREIRTGRVIRQWRGEFGSEPPYPIDEGSLIVAYNAAAELESHIALGWQQPPLTPRPAGGATTAL